MMGKWNPLTNEMCFSPRRLMGLVLLALMWVSVAVGYASPEIKTTPHVFPLHLVSWAKDGPMNPQIALKADFVAYANLPSYKQFLDSEGGSSPEGTVALRVQAILEAINSSGDAVKSARKFYDSGIYEGHDDWTANSIDRDIEGSVRVLKNYPDIRFWHRYDFGAATFITVGYMRTDGVRFSSTLCLHKVGESYLIIPHGILVNDTLNLSWLLVYLSDSHMIVRKDDLNAVSLPSYEYHFRLRSPLSDESSEEHPVEILFNGRPSNILVNDDMVPTDWAQAFVKRAVQLFDSNSGALGYLFQYDEWTDQDAQIPLSGVEVKPTTPTANRNPVRIVFSIDFGVQSLLFVQVGESKKLERVIVSKRFAPDGRWVKPEHFPGNLLRLIEFPQFQSYISEQSLKANNPPQAAPHSGAAK